MITMTKLVKAISDLQQHAVSVLTECVNNYNLGFITPTELLNQASHVLLKYNENVTAQKCASLIDVDVDDISARDVEDAHTILTFLDTNHIDIPS